MRKVIAALLLAACPLACGYAEDKKDEPKKETPKLGVGDAAPPLKVTQWLNGDDPKVFQKDKVYVLEFWATWCGPCIAQMPHLTELQKEYKDKGLVVVGLTNKDPNNSQKAVTAFVEKNKAKVGYVMGYSDGEENWAAYMDAAGKDGIPCSFVVGKDGKVAYIGHPMWLEAVLPKVLDGSWNGKEDAKGVDEMDAAFTDVLSQEKPEAALEKMAAFAKKYPQQAAKGDLRGLHLGLLVGAKKFDDAKVMAEEMIAASEKGKKADPAKHAVALASPDANPEKKHYDVGLKALETALKYDDKDLRLLFTAVQVYAAAGDKEKAAAYGKKAVEAAPEEDRAAVQKAVDQIQNPKK